MSVRLRFLGGLRKFSADHGIDDANGKIATNADGYQRTLVGVRCRLVGFFDDFDCF